MEPKNQFADINLANDIHGAVRYTKNILVTLAAYDENFIRDVRLIVNW